MAAFLCWWHFCHRSIKESDPCIFGRFWLFGQRYT